MAESGQTRDRLILAFLIAAAILVRLIHIGQPIVENYVGRQIPTAMVARNLERGSGFTRPRLDIEPSPNLFLVEPPLYQVLVGCLARFMPLSLEEAGRCASALGMGLAAWGLHGLAARRDGRFVGLAAVAAFAAFPVTLRYGRSFQPDAMMLGLVTLGLDFWDRHECQGRLGWLAAGWLSLALGLAIKVSSAFVLVPLALGISRQRTPSRLLLIASTLIPAFAWYLHAASLAGHEAGSRATADNAAVWIGVLIPTAWLRAATYEHIARLGLLRAFTPLGAPLALMGLLGWGRADRLWTVWGISALAALAVLAAKLHHEYYWLAVAPVVAVGVGRALVRLLERPGLARGTGVLLIPLLLGLDVAFSLSTWKTPDEWKSLSGVASSVNAFVPAEALIVAPEAVAYFADRRGCRLEFSAASARRAAGEWPEVGTIGSVASAADLVEFYRDRGADYFVDVTPHDASPERLALHAEVRRRYKILMDRDGVLIAALRPARHASHVPQGTTYVPGPPGESHARPQ